MYNDGIWFMCGSFSLEVEHPGEVFSSRDCQAAIAGEALNSLVSQVDAEDLLSIHLDWGLNGTGEGRIVNADHKFVCFEEGILEVNGRWLG